MRRLAISLLTALLVLSCGAASQAEVEQSGNLRVHFNAGFAPRSLPRLHPAPIEVSIEGGVATADGSHPPPLRRLEVELNRSGRLFADGLPTCSPSRLQSTSSGEARARCGGAVVGRGSFSAELALGSADPVLADGPILAFNGRSAGKPALLLHFFGDVPVRFTLVVPLKIGHRKQGRFGTVLRARIPKLAGDFGSITGIELALGRRYVFAGKRRSYLSAACSAPAGFPAAVFSFARAGFRFEGHQPIRSTLIRTCRVR
jgi:hypothetical protein